MWIDQIHMGIDDKGPIDQRISDFFAICKIRISPDNVQ
jgi:hypothetical protein